MTFRSEYPAHCGVCDGYMPKGSYVRQYLNRVAHDVCPGPVPEARRDICPVCFTERAANGRCMCHV